MPGKGMSHFQDCGVFGRVVCLVLTMENEPMRLLQSPQVRLFSLGRMAGWTLISNEHS